MKRFFCIISILFTGQILYAQKIQILTDSNRTSLRGISVVDDNLIWVSGSNGKVGKSTDSGKTWEWFTVKDFENTDFRDVEGFNKNEAVIMGVGEPAYILRTSDGGKNWNTVFEDKSKGMFLDAMEFWNEQSGIVIGDPVNNRFFIGRTFDGGRTWRSIPEAYKPVAAEGEYCFAASGTNIRKSSKAEAVFVTGGLTSQIFIRDKRIVLPLAQHKESAGANSISIKDKKTMIVVGGDYKQENDTAKNCAITHDGGNTWSLPEKSPSGYRSCVEYLNKDKWITCGPNGIDISSNDGRTWTNISKEGFYVCRKAKKGNAVYLAGSDGRIGGLVE